jgi:hypothetical protein
MEDASAGKKSWGGRRPRIGGARHRPGAVGATDATDAR